MRTPVDSGQAPARTTPHAATSLPPRSRRRPAASAAVSALLALAAPGCTATVALAPKSPEAALANTTSRIGRKRLPAIEGAILESDHETVAVERCGDDRVIPVARASIRDIDHPGNVLAALGFAVAGIGSVLLPTGILYGLQGSGVNYYGSSYPGGGDSYGATGRAIGATGVALFVVGSALGVTGIVIWRGSKDAAQD